MNVNMGNGLGATNGLMTSSLVAQSAPDAASTAVPVPSPARTPKGKTRS